MFCFLSKTYVLPTFMVVINGNMKTRDLVLIYLKK
jgi:hypothetical protein